MLSERSPRRLKRKNDVISELLLAGELSCLEEAIEGGAAKEQKCSPAIRGIDVLLNPCICLLREKA